MKKPKMPWGMAAGIVPKYAISKNREFQTFFGVSLFIFPGISLKKIGWKNKYRRRCECTTYIDGVFYSLPSNQLTDTFRISARAFNSISDTGCFRPSSKDSAGTLISIPASCNLASSSTCFIPCANRASVTRLPMMLRSPRSSFRGFIRITAHSRPRDHQSVPHYLLRSKQIRSGRISSKRNWKSAVTQHPTWSGISLSKRIRSIRSQTGFTLWSITIKNGTPERTKFFVRKSRINTGFTERIRYIFRIVI